MPTKVTLKINILYLNQLLVEFYFSRYIKEVVCNGTYQPKLQN